MRSAASPSWSASTGWLSRGRAPSLAPGDSEWEAGRALGYSGTGVVSSSQRTSSGPLSTNASMSSGVVCGPDVRVRYSIASSRLSETSVSAMWWLFGIHSIPAETAVVPPRNSVRSRTRTRSPACAGGRAAHRAAPPEPRTITSTSLRGSIWFSTSEGRGKGSGLAGPALEPVQRERGDDHEAQRELLVEGLDVDEG